MDVVAAQAADEEIFTEAPKKKMEASVVLPPAFLLTLSTEILDKLELEENAAKQDMDNIRTFGTAAREVAEKVTDTAYKKQRDAVRSTRDANFGRGARGNASAQWKQVYADRSAELALWRKVISRRSAEETAWKRVSEVAALRASNADLPIASAKALVRHHASISKGKAIPETGALASYKICCSPISACQVLQRRELWSMF